MHVHEHNNFIHLQAIEMIEKDNKNTHEKYILHIHTNCTAFRVFVHPKNEK